MLHWTLRVGVGIYAFKPWFSLPSNGIAGSYVSSIFSFFEEPPILFSRMAVPIYIPISLLFFCVCLVLIPYFIVAAQFWFSSQQVILPVGLCYKVYWWHCGIRISDCFGSFRIYCEILWSVWISSPSAVILRLIIQALQWVPLDS